MLYFRHLVLAGTTILLASSCGKETSRVVADTVSRQADFTGAQSQTVATCPAATTCFADTAVARSLDYEPGSAIDATWWIFTDPDDSLVIDAVHDSAKYAHPSVTAVVGEKVYQERDAKGNSDDISHFNVGGVRAVRVVVSLDDTQGEDTISYRLRVKRAGHNSGQSPLNGQRARLLLDAPSTRRIALIPHSAPSRQRSPQSWALPPGDYRVALTADSIYAICALPCLKPDTVKLLPGSKLVRRY